ncbi:PilN domain-containing protein [Marinobacteraceae bacterium S3BR75-40.1]
MIQDVNLYTEDLKPKKDPLTLERAVALVAVLAVLVVLAALWSQWSLSQLQARQQKLAANIATAQTEVDSLSEKVAQQSESQALKQAVEQARLTLVHRNELAKRMENLTLSGTEGFSRYLEGLARQVTPGLWLTGVDISSAARHLELRGLARDGDLVPQYLQNLEQEPAFAGQRFGFFELERSDESAGLQFVVASQRPGESER